MKVVIVGGVAGGASAAARIRRLDEHAQIVMIERSGYMSYANCGLPYYVGGVIKEQEELTLQPMTNCSSHPAQSRRFPPFPAWTASGPLPCAPWKTPSAFGAL